MIRSSAALLAPGATRTIDAHCNAGERATGGGVSSIDSGMLVYTSAPIPQTNGATPTGWEVSAKNTTSGFDGFAVFAICASP